MPLYIVRATPAVMLSYLSMIQLTRYRRWIATAAAGLLISQFACADSLELADDVNTLQGTDSSFELTRGNTFPATALPFGMHMWTPQTGRNGDGWKYQYQKDTIRGFQQAHQCSSWTNDYAVFSLMPVVGELVVDENLRATKFRHEDETAKPHYYRVQLASGVTTEIVPTERGAFLRFSFPSTGDAYLVFDGYVSQCSLEIQPDERRIVGRLKNGRNLSEKFRNYFVLIFDQPIVAHGTWRGDDSAVLPNEQKIAGHKVGAYLKFEPGSTVNVRVASSYISDAQAETTLQHELAQFATLEDVRQAAEIAWNDCLGKITIEGGSDEERRTFYSCLYRASLFPHKFYEVDADGQPHYFSPYDGQVHAGYLYTDTGLWDVFRAQMPLHVLLFPEMQGRDMQALLAAYHECGWLPSWSFPGEGGSMIGNHAIALLADAWIKGIRTFDPAEAIAAYAHESSAKGPWGPANGREGAEEIERLGYLPYPKYREATAKTLDYAYDDFCGYQLARATDQTKLEQTFAKRMFNYRNVYDPSTGFMRGRDEHGEWTPNFDPTEWGGPFTEGCAWHWHWSVFHDVAGLIALTGGDQAFIAKLDSVFTQPCDFKAGTYGSPIHEMREMVMANMGQFAPGNQPMQHVVYLYNYAGEPWKSQYWARKVMKQLYNSTQDGYPGDDDQGQTSAWYVLSALGFYPVCPGTDQYVFGSPLFDKASIAVRDGKRFTITANHQSPENVYIQSALLNGMPLTRNYLLHDEIASGGSLVLEMGPSPNLERGTHPEDRPFSVSTAAKIPSLSDGGRSSTDSSIVSKGPAENE